MLSVIHVDPNAGFRGLLKQRLETADPGVSVEPVVGSAEALTRCARNGVDAILIGHSLLLDALELARSLKRVTRAPIIVYTFEGDENVSNLIVDAGADAYLTMGRSLDDPALLSRRIRSIINRTGGMSLPIAVLESIHRSAPRILASRNVRDLAKNTMDAIEASFASEITSFMLVEGDGLVCVERRWRPNRIKIPLGSNGPLARAVREGRAISVGYAEAEPPEDAAIRSELSVPVLNGDSVLAVVDMRSSIADAFGEADAKAVETLCLYVGCTFRLISELKAVLDAEKQYRDLLSSLGEAVAVLVDSNYAYINQRGAELLGYSNPGEVVGKDIFSSVSQEYLEVVRDRLSRQLGNNVDTYEFRLVRRDGSTVLVEAEISRIKFEGKEAYLMIEKDVSGVREREARLKSYVSDLEKQVENRTQELVEAQRFAAAGKLASMVGHDLRSPLQSIRNATYLIRRQPERIDEMLNSVDLSVDRALAMLEDLRYKTRETPLKLGPVDLPALIVDVLKDTPVPENVQVDVRLDPDLKVVELDSLKIRRVLDNLVRNSIEAMPSGGKLTVQTAGSVDTFSVSVSDTGVGIPEENFPSLFKPFYTTKTRGLGLGLAYSLKAVEAHGGKIEVHSKIGEGTTFRILLGKQLLSQVGEEKDR